MERYEEIEQAHITLLKQIEALQIGMAEADACSFWAEELKKIIDEAKGGTDG
jgi:hypothetical protein